MLAQHCGTAYTLAWPSPAMTAWLHRERHPNGNCDHVATGDPNGACLLDNTGPPMHPLSRLPLWPHGVTTSASPVSTTLTVSMTAFLPGTPMAHACLTTQDHLHTLLAMGLSCPHLHTMQHLQCASIVHQPSIHTSLPMSTACEGYNSTGSRTCHTGATC